MKVWIDQDLCTGDGLCEEIAPDRSGTAYALAVEELEAVLAAPVNAGTDTGPCLD